MYITRRYVSLRTERKGCMVKRFRRYLFICYFFFRHIVTSSALILTRDDNLIATNIITISIMNVVRRLQFQVQEHEIKSTFLLVNFSYPIFFFIYIYTHN